MKKLSIFTLLLAGSLVWTGCEDSIGQYNISEVIDIISFDIVLNGIK